MMLLYSKYAEIYLFVDLPSLMVSTQMLRNLLTKRSRPIPALHFNLTFQRTGSTLPCSALASFHPHGFWSLRSLTSFASKAAAGPETGGFHTASNTNSSFLLFTFSHCVTPAAHTAPTSDLVHFLFTEIPAASESLMNYLSR